MTLREKLVAQGLDVMEEFLRKVENGPWAPTPQSGEVLLAPSLTKEDGRIRWGQRSAVDSVNLIRGTYEWPGAFGVLKGQRLKIRRAESEIQQSGRPGEIIAVEKGRGFLVKCATGSLRVLRVQPEGKKEMEASDFWNGAHLAVGDRFEE